MTDTAREAVARAMFELVHSDPTTKVFLSWETLGRDVQDVWLAMAAAAIDAYEAVTPGDGWRDIATAPKDETWCLLYSPHAEAIVVAFYAADQPDGQDGWYESEAASNPSLESDTFTHWRPCPAPPAAQEPALHK